MHFVQRTNSMVQVPREKLMITKLVRNVCLLWELKSLLPRLH